MREAELRCFFFCFSPVAFLRLERKGFYPDKAETRGWASHFILPCPPLAESRLEEKNPSLRATPSMSALMMPITAVAHSVDKISVHRVVAVA